MKQQMVAPSSLVSDASADVQPSGFFSCLNANDRRQLMMLGASASWGGNEILFAQGAPVTQCFAVIDGVVALSRGIGDGRRQIIGFALAGDILEIAADGRHELSAVTIGPA